MDSDWNENSPPHSQPELNRNNEIKSQTVGINPLCIYVSRLPDDMNVERLTDMFSPYGKFHRPYLNMSKKFAMINFENTEEPLKAINSLHCKPPLYLQVTLAVKKSDQTINFNPNNHSSDPKMAINKASGVRKSFGNHNQSQRSSSRGRPPRRHHMESDKHKETMENTNSNPHQRANRPNFARNMGKGRFPYKKGSPRRVPRPKEEYQRQNEYDNNGDDGWEDIPRNLGNLSLNDGNTSKATTSYTNVQQITDGLQSKCTMSKSLNDRVLEPALSLTEASPRVRKLSDRSKLSETTKISATTSLTEVPMVKVLGAENLSVIYKIPFDKNKMDVVLDKMAGNLKTNGSSIDEMPALQWGAGCAMCGRGAAGRCARCGALAYCSRACQFMHWTTHHATRCALP